MPRVFAENKVPTIALNNGIRIPMIGNGPGILGHSVKYSSNENNALYFVKRVYNKLDKKIFREHGFINAIVSAFQAGFFLFDYSAAYGNEGLIGKAIKRCGIKRERLFLTTRVSNNQQIKGNIRDQFFRTLEAYKTGYIDLYMFHWPVSRVYLNTWKQMESLYKEGYCKAIGVANCHQHHLEALFERAEIIPAINQIEVHPLFTQKPLVNYCNMKKIVVEAYTPIARFDDRLVRLPALQQIAQKYNKSVVQVILRWHIQNGIIPIVRSLNKNRQLENISIIDFELTKDEMKTIDDFNINSRLRYDPDNCDFTIL
jgi:diketogulonate reductase-like aldo/keto reductase